MAETGFRLVVPQEMIDRLAVADEKIEKIAKTSEDAQKRIDASFKAMAQGGIDEFIKKLNEAQQALANMNNANVQGGNFSELAKNAKIAADDVNRLAEVLNKLPKSTNSMLGGTATMQNNTSFDNILNNYKQKIDTLKREMDIFKQWESGNLLNTKDYAHIGRVADEVNKLIAAYDALYQMQKKMGRNTFQEYIGGLGGNSIQDQQSKHILNRMREFYEEQDRLARQQAKEQAKIEEQKRKELEKTAKEAERLARQQAKEQAKIEEQKRKELEKTAKEAERLARQQAKEQSRMRRNDYNRYVSTQDTYDHAMNVSGRAKTLNQEIRAVKALEQARANLNKTDAQYEQKLRNLNTAILQHKRNIDKATQGSENLQNSHKGLMNISKQLTRRLALVFSVSQITGYVNKLISVRGEFELQQRSLQAILQNKDEADKLWQQTVDLAVRSPFRVKELVTYTKQLAAYRVETEKLHDTTRMLSDVSAGLGVDMQRLILAFGQVKAANYLRGTELRQFSEAGINILGELATYFTELEGRAVSVGDVFERVSKRMVAFSDVEEIFKRLTSEGGTFYRMQEIQSETLKGLMSNLGDSIDLMLNDIGRANDDTLKTSIASIRNLVENWRELAFVIKTFVMPPLGAYLTISTLLKAANSSFAASLLYMAMSFQRSSAAIIATEQGLARLFTRMGLGVTTTSKLIKILGGFATLGVAGVIAGVVVVIISLITKLTSASRAAKQLKKDLEEIYNQDTTNLDLQVRGYENLIARLKDVNIGSREHKEIIDQLNSRYGEYIGFLVDEKTTYDQLANSIDSVTLALTRRAKMATFEKALGKVYESTNKTILDSEKVVKETFEKFSQRELDGKLVAFKPTVNELDKIFKEIERKTEELGRELKKDEIASAIGDALGFKTIFATDTRTINNFYDAILKRTDAITQRKEEELKINQEINSLYKENANSANEAKKAFDDLAKNEEDALKAATNKPKWEQEAIKRNFAQQRIDLQVNWEGLDSATAEFRKKMLKETSATIDDVNKKIEQNSGKLGEKYANLIYIDTTQASTGLTQIAENTASAYKAQQEIIKQQNALKDAGTAYDEDILENAQKTSEAYYYKLQLLGRLDLLEKERNKEEKKELQLLNKQLSALKEAKQTFDNLKKSFSVEEATERTAKAFENLFKELDMSSFTIDMSFDGKGILDVLKQIPNEAGEAGRIAIERLRSELQGGLDVDTIGQRDKDMLQSIEKMFSGYEVSLELQKLNIPNDWAKEFFGIDTFDLGDIRKKIEQQLATGNYGEKTREELEKDLKKVEEMEVKAQQERLKKYLQYARDAIGDRAKIKLEEMKKLQEIEDTFTSPEQEEVKQKAIAKVRKDSEQEQNKLDWEEFQKSDTFISLFSDLDSASSALINHSLAKLREFKEQWRDMPMEDMRAIVQKINELELALAASNPFEGVRDLNRLIKQSEQDAKFASVDAQKIAKQGDYASAFAIERAYQEERAQAAQQEISDIETIIRAKEEGQNLDEISLNLNRNQQLLSVLSLDTLKGMLQIQKSQKSNAEQQVANSNDYLTNLTKQQKKLQGQSDAIQQAQQMANDLYGAFKDLSDVLGGTDSVGAIFADMGINMLNTVMNCLALQVQLEAASIGATEFGAAMNAAMGIIGWIVMAVQLISQILGAIFAAHDKRLENQIEDLQEKVDELNKKLETLEKQLDKAFNVRQLQQYTNEIKRNINAQIRAYEQMIRLEEDKKKTDKDKIKDYKESIEELKQTQKELQEEAVSTATSGILDSVRDAARDFVDAWYDAFSETGDGLQGLKDNFREVMLEMVQQQASMTIAGNFLDRWKKQLDKYINPNDLELTTQEAKAWVDSVQKELPMLNEALEEYFRAMEQAGVDLSGTTNDMSGLQRGIQQLSESTGQELAAYLNSIRFFVADTNTKLSQIVDGFFNPDGANPMLSQLRIIAQQTTAIHSLLDSLTTPHPTLAGRGLKVVL